MSKNRAYKSGAWLACVLALVTLAAPTYSQDLFILADPVNKVSVVLSDLPCELTEKVKNLPRKAVWKDGDKEVEGCYGYKFGFVLMYFDDKTTVVIPEMLFKKLEEA